MVDPEQIFRKRRRRNRERGIAVEALDREHKRQPLNVRKLPICFLELAVERTTAPGLIDPAPGQTCVGGGGDRSA
jgi:hypothetical protein